VTAEYMTTTMMTYYLTYNGDFCPKPLAAKQSKSHSQTPFRRLKRNVSQSRGHRVFVCFHSLPD